MGTRKRYLWVAVLIVITIVGTILAVRWSKPQESPPGLIKVRMGLVGTPDILDLPYFIAQENGFFKEEGLDVEFVSLNGDVLAVQSLAAESIDVSATGLFAVINAIEEGLPLKAFVSVQRSHDYVLCSARDINNIAQLKGKTVGIFAPGDITEIVTINLLQKHGINKSEVNWLSIGGSDDRYRALIAKRVAAVPLHADLGYKIQNDPGFHVLVSIAQEQPLPMSVVSATERTIQDKPQVVSGITRALIKAARYATTNKERFIEIAANHLKDVNREEISAVYDFLMNMKIYGVNGGITNESIETGIKALANTGELKESIPANRIANFDLINSALKELGRHEQ